MSKYEKIGAFLLFDKVEEDKLSKNFLAGQIVNNQIQNVCMVKKFDHSLTTLADFILDLNQEYETLKTLTNPNIVRPNAFVQDKSEFAAVYDYVEGKSLRQVLSRCSQDGFPFTVDHSLLIGSRLCTALEYLHSKKVNEQRLVHGFVCPETVLVTYDGEIKLQYFALAHALMKFPAGREKFFHDYKNYLAPELLNQQKWDKGVDIFGAGLVLYEMLTGEALFARGRDISIEEAIENAQMFSNSGERVPVPDDLKKVLHQSLKLDVAQRYPSIADMRKALDLLLFSSDFSPTTFNLAFFMHSLFRESIDEEEKNINNIKKIDVSDFIKEEPPPPKKEHPVGAVPAKDIPVPISMEREPSFPVGEMFGMETPKEKSKAPIFIGALLVLAALGTVGFLFLKPSQPVEQGKITPAPAAPTVIPEEQKLREAERQRLLQEAEQAKLEAQKKDELLKQMQAELEKLKKAQEELAKKAAGEQKTAQPVVDEAMIRRLEEQAKKLEEEKRQQQLLAEQKLKEAQAPVGTTPPPTPTQETLPPEKLASVTPVDSGGTTTPVQQGPGEPKQVSSGAEPAVKEGDLVEVTPDVIKPSILYRVEPSYPPVARNKKIEGTVILSVLISEKGDVADVKVLRGAGSSVGLDEAAVAAVKKWKFRPAVKDGKRVKVWMTYPVLFKLQ